jgi:hypothetical protein
MRTKPWPRMQLTRSKPDATNRSGTNIASMRPSRVRVKTGMVTCVVYRASRAMQSASAQCCALQAAETSIATGSARGPALFVCRRALRARADVGTLQKVANVDLSEASMKDLEVSFALLSSMPSERCIALFAFAALAVAAIAIIFGERLIALIALVAIAFPAFVIFAVITVENRKS